MRGVLLLGTPHFRLDTLGAAERYFQLARKKTPTDCELREISNWVVSIPQQFASLRESGAQFSIECFYEGSTTNIRDGDVKIVDMSLARCLGGPPAERLGGNHQQISQFGSSEDKDFVKVARVVTRWVAKIPSPEKEGAVNYVSNATFSGVNHGMQLGQNTGTMNGLSFGRG